MNPETALMRPWHRLVLAVFVGAFVATLCASCGNPGLANPMGNPTPMTSGYPHPPKH